MKTLAILGSTGSIGTQTLEVVDRFPQMLQVHTLAGGTNGELFASQILRYRPRYAYLADPLQQEGLKPLCRNTGTVLLEDMDALCTVLSQEDDLDAVLAAISGFAGLRPVWASLQGGREIALANKETLVAAGHLVMDQVRRRNIRLLPVDSEHSAIFQCLENRSRQVEKLILTASGGPFRDLPQEELEQVTPEMALAHPNWSMGRKITVDSATLANKGLEVIEARILFDIAFEQIDVVVHRESIVHSLVQFVDGSVLAQLGLPDMSVPIQYALSCPSSWPTDLPRLDLVRQAALHFEAPRRSAFPCLELGYEAGALGPAGGLSYNTANELAVERFLGGDIGFGDIPRLIRTAMERYGQIPLNCIEDVYGLDQEIRAAL